MHFAVHENSGSDGKLTESNERLRRVQGERCGFSFVFLGYYCSINIPSRIYIAYTVAVGVICI